MVKEKPQEDANAPQNESNVSIFATLFGGGADENTKTSSIFSDSNPFKRKIQDESPSKSDSATVEVKKKVKKKDKNNHVAVPENVSVEQIEKKERKKRKRDEVEKVYEEKMYGAKPPAVEAEVVGKKRKRKKAEEETEEMMMTANENEEGFDDENKLLRTIFVGNLPLKVKKKLLSNEFSKFGEIQSVRIRSVPIIDTKVPRKGAILKKQINDNVDSVHAYIVFKSEESAEAALTHNMAVVGGNHIRVDRACPPRKKLKGEDAPLYDNKRTIFVGNLPFDVKDEEVYQLFCGLSNVGSDVEAVRVVRHSHMRVGKGIAYVLFKTREAANLVVKKRNLKLRDRELRISHADKNSTPSKREYSSPPSAISSPSKKFRKDSNASGSASRSNPKSPMSYQGLRASKSGAQKKIHSSVKPVKMKKSTTQKEGKQKIRLEKRPSVALRKAKAKAQPDGGAKHAGSKRKLDSRTPENFQRKKTKKFK